MIGTTKNREVKSYCNMYHISLSQNRQVLLLNKEINKNVDNAKMITKLKNILQ